ncbi:MAG: hypothetical protein ACYCVH_16620 [Ignavibacteriaceae bacterium]
MSIKNIEVAKNQFLFKTNGNPVSLTAKGNDSAAVVSLFISPNKNESNHGKNFLGFFFDHISGLIKGMTFWRYKPWNSWTKQIIVNNINTSKAETFNFWRTIADHFSGNHTVAFLELNLELAL